MGRMRIGAKLPSSGSGAHDVELGAIATRAEEAGFDSLWVSDHVVMPAAVSSPYPFSADGTMSWRPEEPWYDAVVAMSTAAAVTQRVEIGVGVLIVPMRNPLVLAKQIASLDALSAGRIVLGAGAGWLAEEFDALNAPFETRGERLDRWIDLMRESWTGQLEPSEGLYGIPSELFSYPTPTSQIPVLIGGMSRPALRRVACRGDGWFAFQHADAIDPSTYVSGLELIREEAGRAGRESPDRVAVRMPGDTTTISNRLSELADAGVTDVVVDVDWEGDGPRRTAEVLLSAVS